MDNMLFLDIAWNWMVSLVVLLLLLGGDYPSMVHETFGKGPTYLFIRTQKIVNIKLKSIWALFPDFLNFANETCLDSFLLMLL